MDWGCGCDRPAEGGKQTHERRAAALILKLMVENRFPRIWVPTVAERDLRQLLIHRHHLVGIRKRIKNQLQHIALNHGWQKKRRLWSEAGLKLLRSLELEPWTEQRRNTLLQMLLEFGGEDPASGPGGSPTSASV